MIKKMIIISGATATGKTELSLKLACHLDAEIINFDSLLFYHELNIGTAKPTPDELKLVPHHLISTESIGCPINAADFSKKASHIIRQLRSKNKSIVLVGGSGFYLQALIKGMFESENTSEVISHQSNVLYQEEGIEPFREILKQYDPISFAQYHSNDHYRIRRAVEHFWTTRVPFSIVREKKNEENVTIFKPEEYLQLYLELPKEEHLKIISKRTQLMIHNGLVEEVENLIKLGFSGNEKPLQSVGYKETIQWLRGEFKTYENYIERINTSTWQLAKSQKTWFKKDQFKTTFHPLRDQQKMMEIIASLKDQA